MLYWSVLESVSSSWFLLASFASVFFPKGTWLLVQKTQTLAEDILWSGIIVELGPSKISKLIHFHVLKPFSHFRRQMTSFRLPTFVQDDSFDVPLNNTERKVQFFQQNRWMSKSKVPCRKVSFYCKKLKIVHNLNFQWPWCSKSLYFLIVFFMFNI